MNSFYSFKRIKKYDLLTTGYLLIWILLILIHYKTVPSADTFLLLHFLTLLVVIFMGGLSPVSPFLKVIRYYYQFFFLPLFFTALHYLIPAIHPGNVDSTLIKIDQYLTHTNPTIWIEQFYYPVLTELLQLVYLTFYFLPLVVLIPLYCSDDLKRYDRFAFAILLSFYLSYFGYLLFPALGPRYFLSHLHSVSLDGLGLYHSISSTLNGLENIQWDAFPSGHVAVALLVSHFSYRFYPKIFYFTLPIIILLIISTIYLRYHYLVDVLAGVLLYLIIIIIDRLVYSTPISGDN
jgi:membrane-associated phospholipid phosphatase